MKRSSIIEARRMQVNPEVRQRVDLSFQIVDRIYEILQAKGLRQKDLAQLLGKKEAEISKHRACPWRSHLTSRTHKSIRRCLRLPAHDGQRTT